LRYVTGEAAAGGESTRASPRPRSRARRARAPMLAARAAAIWARWSGGVRFEGLTIELSCEPAEKLLATSAATEQPQLDGRLGHVKPRGLTLAAAARLGNPDTRRRRRRRRRRFRSGICRAPRH